MDRNYLIRNMRPEELNLAIEWARNEGWDPGINDPHCFFAADPSGFFIGELNGEPICVASAVNYDQSSSFFGLYIVKKEFRGQGYGLKMTEHRLAYAAQRNAGLDGVLENVEMYKKKGFKPYYINQRFKHIGEQRNTHTPFIVALSQVPFEDCLEYDQKCFFGPREAFLKEWIAQPNSTALAFVKDNKLMGYGVCRKTYQGYKIGPLFADNEEVADSLFLALQNNKFGEAIFIDIPETNLIGKKLVEQYKLMPVFTVMRMYNKYLPELDYNKVVGNTTYELG